MATVRKLTGLKADASVAQLNKLRLDMMRLRAGLVFHASASTAVSTANASDLATSIALITALQAAYTAHIASACSSTSGVGAHMAADATNVLTAPTPTDLASCITAVNELKAEYNLHRVVTSCHPVADSTNAVSTADATDLASVIALANDVKAKLNAHFAAAFTSEAIELVSP
ncbi:hypothetical protein [Polyangium spumosum]|uniref:Uncharacterized protein n=1 Tax=Polyangium spumosum TaxID=889282 RepID=A0A6N7Q3E6_9BACT|nr:hypothetical protein [Polyangium spumosum]MRG98217.1 hypothetical protein [Polyangium spumosum]